MLVRSQLKYIQSLGQKKHRDESNLFIAEGPKLVAELLDEMPSQLQQLFATEIWLDSNKEKTEGIECTPVSNDELQRLSQLSTANQVIAVVKKFVLPPVIDVKGRLTLALDNIQDPGNLGTILRIADWFGIPQVVCSHDCADIYNPKVVQASMGSIIRVKAYYMDLHAWLNTVTDINVYAAMLDGEDLTTIGKIKEGILIIGNESRGIQQELLDHVQVRITIPGKGRAESLNAAVATGIILSHLS
jgi:TrmH family RNA methyltransferase